LARCGTKINSETVDDQRVNDNLNGLTLILAQNWLHGFELPGNIIVSTVKLI